MCKGSSGCADSRQGIQAAAAEGGGGERSKEGASHHKVDGFRGTLGDLYKVHPRLASRDADGGDEAAVEAAELGGVLVTEVAHADDGICRESALRRRRHRPFIPHSPPSISPPAPPRLILPSTSAHLRSIV